MNTIFPLIALIIGLYVNAQTYKVKYDSSIEQFNYTVDLITDSDYSMTIFHFDVGNYTVYPEGYHLKISETDSIALHNGDFIYFSDNINKVIYSDNFILKRGGRFWVKENIPQIDWEFESLNDTKIAKGEFMGRSYQAKYNQSMRHLNGPLKFQGLPGLITEIESPNYIKLSMKEIDTVYVNWEEIIKQLNILKPQATEVSVFKKELDENLSEKLMVFDNIKSVDDLAKHNLPGKLFILEQSYYEDYNNQIDIKMEQIMKMVEIQKAEHIKKK